MEIPLYKPNIDNRANKKIEQVIQSGWISSQGEAVEEFETELKDLLGIAHCVAVDSGTAALQLAMESLDIGSGDKVAVPAFTFGATAMAVKNTGAQPVLVDVERERFGIDPDRLRQKARRENLDAVVVAHLFGRPAKIEQIMEVASSNDMHVVEDAAQVLGTEFRGRKLGTFGEAAAFSFSWNKTVTTGKGGAVVTDNQDLAEKIAGMASQGAKKRKFEMREGFNYKMDSIRAGIGCSQMNKFEEISDKKKQIMECYRTKLEDVNDIEVMESVENAELAPWMFFITSKRRESVQEALKEKEIGFRRFYRPLNSLGSFESSETFPVSEELREEGLLLPSYPGMSEEEVERISSVIEDAVR
jgi:perosamine synthetase